MASRVPKFSVEELKQALGGPDLGQALSTGFNQFQAGQELEQNIADKKLARQKTLQDIQTAVAKVKAEQAQKEKEQQFANTLKGPIVANIGGQAETKDLTPSYNLTTTGATAFPEQTYKNILEENLLNKKLEGMARIKSIEGTKEGRQQKSIDERRRLKAVDIANQAQKAILPVQDALTQIEAFGKKFNTLEKEGKAGGGYGTFAKVTGAKALNKLTGGRAAPDLKATTDLRNGLVARIKSLTGDVGVLTDQDAERLINLLPDPAESGPSARSKLQFVTGQIKQAAERKRSSASSLIKQIQGESDIQLPEIQSPPDNSLENFIEE